MFHKWISVTAETYIEVLSKINKINVDHMITTALNIYEKMWKKIQ